MMTGLRGSGDRLPTHSPQRRPNEVAPTEAEVVAGIGAVQVRPSVKPRCPCRTGVAVTLGPQFPDARDADEERPKAVQFEGVAVDVNVHLMTPNVLPRSRAARSNRDSTSVLL